MPYPSEPAHRSSSRVWSARLRVAGLRSSLAALLALAGPLSVPNGICGEPPPPVGTPALTVDEIVRRAVLRDDQLRASRTALKCDRAIRTDRLDPGGKVIDTSTARAVEYPTGAFQYSSSIEPSQGASATGADDIKSEKINAIMSMRRLAPRYEMTLHGEETIRGVPCYAIDFRPKASQPSAASREEKVMSNLHGRFWVSKNDFSVVQSNGTLAGPVTIALVASVNQMDISYHSQSLANGDTCPWEVSVTLAVKAPFYDFRQHQVTTEENWRPR